MNRVTFSDTDYDEILATAVDMHGHKAPGLVVGIRMIQFGLSQLEISPEDKVTITSETTRCLQDAGFSVCHHLINTRGWRIYSKVFEVGKFSIQVSKNWEWGKAGEDACLFRVVLEEEVIQEKYPLFWQWAYHHEEKKTPLEILLANIEEARDDHTIYAIKPFSGQKRAHIFTAPKDLLICAQCGETMNNADAVEEGGQSICRLCAVFEVDAE